TLIPCSLALPPPTICTPSLHDAPPLTKTTPTGTVSFSSDGAGVFAVSPCTLTTTNALDPTAPASCSVTYTPTAKGTGTHKITANSKEHTTEVKTPVDLERSLMHENNNT